MQIIKYETLCIFTTIKINFSIYSKKSSCTKWDIGSLNYENKKPNSVFAELGLYN